MYAGAAFRFGDGGAAKRPLRWLLLFLALLWQAALLHAQVHALPGPAAAHVGHAHAADTGDRHDDSSDCPVCQIVGGSGGEYLSSNPPALQDRLALTFTAWTGTGEAYPAGQSPLGWHSRAPPRSV